MKQSEINNLTDAELQEQIDIKVGDYSNLKMAHAVSPLENPSQLNNARRTIARLKTELSKRQAN